MNILNKESRTADKGWSSRLEVGRGANNSSPQNIMLRNNQSVNLGPRLILWYDLTNKKKDMRFSTWNVRSLYMEGSLTAATGELAR